MPTKKDIDTIDSKKRMLEALEVSLGIVSTAAKKAGLSRAVHYNWYNTDEEYKKKVDDIQEIVVDFVETKLFQLVGKGDTSATIFALKCRGKKRGYAEGNRGIEIETGGDKTIIRFSDAE